MSQCKYQYRDNGDNGEDTYFCCLDHDHAGFHEDAYRSRDHEWYLPDKEPSNQRINREAALEAVLRELSDSVTGIQERPVPKSMDEVRQKAIRMREANKKARALLEGRDDKT